MPQVSRHLRYRIARRLPILELATLIEEKAKILESGNANVWGLPEGHRRADGGVKHPRWNLEPIPFVLGVQLALQHETMRPLQLPMDDDVLLEEWMPPVMNPADVSFLGSVNALCIIPNAITRDAATSY